MSMLFCKNFPLDAVTLNENSNALSMWFTSELATNASSVSECVAHKQFLSKQLRWLRVV